MISLFVIATVVQVSVLQEIVIDAYIVDLRICALDAILLQIINMLNETELIVLVIKLLLINFF